MKTWKGDLQRPEPRAIARWLPNLVLPESRPGGAGVEHSFSGGGRGSETDPERPPALWRDAEVLLVSRQPAHRDFAPTAPGRCVPSMGCRHRHRESHAAEHGSVQRRTLLREETEIIISGLYRRDQLRGRRNRPPRRSAPPEAVCPQPRFRYGGGAYRWQDRGCAIGVPVRPELGRS